MFECTLDSALSERLRKTLKPQVNQKEDSVRFCFLCEACVPKVENLGLGEVSQVRPYSIV